MELYDLRTEYREDPVGIDLTDLTLSWKVRDAAGRRAVGARVEIAEDAVFQRICYDSGVGQFDCFAFSPEGFTPAPAKPYFWRVTVEDDRGDRATSGVASFEGGHPEGGWMGHFIKAPFVRELAPVFVKEFDLEEIDFFQTARLYICGLGLYEAYLNDEKIGEDFFAPGFTDYRHWVQYQTYDIAPYLKKGRNRLAVYMGDGWYMGRFGYLCGGVLRNYYGSEYKLLADVIFADESGTVIGFGTDESWQALKSPVLSSNLYDGEVYDARLEEGLKNPGRQRMHACKAEPAKGLSPMVGLPVRRHEVLKPVQLIRTKRGETVLDFGQEITGWVAFWAQTQPGQEIFLQYGEILQDGCFYRDNLRTARAEYTRYCRGGREFVRPHFAFYGFRYVLVKGMEVTEENLPDFEAWALYSNLSVTGRIETSDPNVNRLIANTVWSQKDNFLDIPTDCPQRDERLGWTGDAQIFSGTADFHMLTGAFFRKYLRDMRYEQQEKGGSVPFVVPDVLTRGRELAGEPEFDHVGDTWGEDGSSVWGEAATVIPWNLYVYYGNPKRLAEQYPNMKGWVDFMIRMDEENCGGERLWTCGFHFGDWLALDSAGYDDLRGGTDRYYIATLHYMYSASLTAKAAAVLGKSEDAAYYGEVATQVRKAIRRKYMTEPGVLAIPTQTAYVLGLHFDLFEPEENGCAVQTLAKLLENNDGKLATGFVGTAFLCRALSECGLQEKAYTLLLNEEYPGWLYAVKLGATTIWERWNSVLPDGTISGTGMNSLNHYAYGVVAEWIYRHVCGLQPEESAPGFQKIRFAPQTDMRLDYARATYESVSGTYRAGWRKEREKMIFELEVPFGCEAQFVPDRAYERIVVNGEPADRTRKLILMTGSYEIEAWG